MTPAFNVLFLCTHNSARSIMAEAILDENMEAIVFMPTRLGPNQSPSRMPKCWQSCGRLVMTPIVYAVSRGTDSTGPTAPHMDFVITLCDTPRGQECPDFGDMAAGDRRVDGGGVHSGADGGCWRPLQIGRGRRRSMIVGYARTPPRTRPPGWRHRNAT